MEVSDLFVIVFDWVDYRVDDLCLEFKLLWFFMGENIFLFLKGIVFVLMFLDFLVLLI